MSIWSAIVLIVLISAVATVMRSHNLGRRRSRDDSPAQAVDNRAREEELQREVTRLQERIAVLEKIATDNNSPEARETQRIAAEIEALRDRQDS